MKTISKTISKKPYYLETIFKNQMFHFSWCNIILFSPKKITPMRILPPTYEFPIFTCRELAKHSQPSQSRHSAIWRNVNESQCVYTYGRSMNDRNEKRWPKKDEGKRRKPKKKKQRIIKKYAHAITITTKTFVKEHWDRVRARSLTYIGRSHRVARKVYKRRARAHTHSELYMNEHEQRSQWHRMLRV